MYQSRLDMLKPRVHKAGMNKWGHGTKARDGHTIVKKDKILNITSNQLCWVSGTVFADMKNKLNILQDVDQGTDDVIPETPASYWEENTTIMLEDESGRAALAGDEIKNHILVTGVVVAVLGIEIQAGTFEVLDIVYPEDGEDRKGVETKVPKKDTGDGNWIALVSSLDIGEVALFNTILLKQFLLGQLGNQEDQKMALGVGQLVVVGNTIRPIGDQDASLDTENYGSKNVSKYNSSRLYQFKQFISDIVTSCNVTIIPGDSDPSDVCLPQQPFHRALFADSKNYVGSNITAATNPTWWEGGSNAGGSNAGGKRALISAGQNIDDVKRYLSRPVLAVDIMAANLKWNHIAPTAPDTLYCYPFDNDPFTLNDEIPQLYIVGNQEKYETKLVEVIDPQGMEVMVTLVTVPKFSSTGEVVMMNIESGETKVMRVA